MYSNEPVGFCWKLCHLYPSIYILSQVLFVSLPVWTLEGANQSCCWTQQWYNFFPYFQGSCGAYVLVDVPQWPSRLPLWLQVACIFLAMTRWAERQEFWETMGSIGSDRWWSGRSKRLLLLEVCCVDSFRSKVVDCPALLRGSSNDQPFCLIVMVKFLVLSCWVGHQ